MRGGWRPAVGLSTGEVPPAAGFPTQNRGGWESAFPPRLTPKDPMQINITAIKAVNGWLVMPAPSPGAYANGENAYVVKEGDSLAEAVAAVLVSMRLDDKTQQKSAESAAAAWKNSLLNSKNAVVMNELTAAENYVLGSAALRNT